MNYEYVSWNRFVRLCGTLYRRVNRAGYRPDMILAIERGGYPVGRLLSDYLGVMELVGLKVEHCRGPDKMPRVVIPYPVTAEVGGRRLLIVDDVSDSGDTFNAVLPHIALRGEPAALRTLVLHHKQTSSYVPDFHGQRVLKWRWITYPWAVVEDVTILASRLERPPESVSQLRSGLAREIGFELPSRVFAEVGPVVIDRLADAAQGQ